MNKTSFQVQLPWVWRGHLRIPPSLFGHREPIHCQSHLKLGALVVDGQGCLDSHDSASGGLPPTGQQTICFGELTILTFPVRRWPQCSLLFKKVNPR